MYYHFGGWQRNAGQRDIVLGGGACFPGTYD